jgi:hypothetical protein
MAKVPVLEFQRCWTQKLASLKSECHAIMNKYPKADPVVQQVYKVLSDIENLARCTPLKLGKALRSSHNRNTFCFYTFLSIFMKNSKPPSCPSIHN